MKRIKQLSIWMIALLAITVTNPAWAADTQPPQAGQLQHHCLYPDHHYDKLDKRQR